MGIFLIDWVTKCKIDCRENPEVFLQQVSPGAGVRGNHESVSNMAFAGVEMLLLSYQLL